MKNIFILFYETRSLTLRNQLVQQNVGLARKVTHAQVKSSMQAYEDLFPCAVTGLIKAIERFNPHQNDYFSSFAMPYIRGEIQHYLRDKVSTIRLHRKYQELATKRQKTTIKLAKKLGRNPSKSELISELQLTPEQFQDLEIAIANRNNQYRLDMPLAGSENLTLGEAIPAPATVDYGAIEQLWLQVEFAIAKINPPMTRQALALIYLDGTSINEASTQLGVTEDNLKILLCQGVLLLSKSIEIPLAEIVEITANFGEEKHIKSVWDKAMVCLESSAVSAFAEYLQIA